MNAIPKPVLRSFSFGLLLLLLASPLAAEEKKAVVRDLGGAEIKANSMAGISYAPPAADSSWIASGPVTASMDGSVTFSYPDLSVSIVPFSAGNGYGGIVIDKSSSDVMYAPGINWKIDANDKWSMGMDTLNQDFYFAYDWSIQADVFRVAPGGKFVMGPGVGTAANDDCQLFIVTNMQGGISDSGLEPLGLQSKYNGLRGMYIRNWSNGNAAGARLRLGTDSPLGTLDLVFYGFEHATKSTRAWIGTTGPASLRLGCNNQEQLTFFVDQIWVGPRMKAYGGYSVLLNSAPADASVSAGECIWWYDPTPGAAKARFIGKDANGVVVNGSLPLN